MRRSDPSSRRSASPAPTSAAIDVDHAASATQTTGARQKLPEGAAPTSSGTRRAVGFGKYRLFARLGSGGMADVYLAVAQGAMNVNRLVVIKRLRDEHANDSSIREMFLDEARLAARLNHPNVIQTFEAGNEGSSFFLAMEYVEGQPLSRILTALKQAGKTLEPRLAARLLADALNGLHYAHELTDFDDTPIGIVHRDVSPQNIMVTYEGAVKLVDFGIAKAVGTTQTAHGVFKGKVAFMAPEQVRCEEVDRRADLFAAGIVLWESATGKHLMADSTPAATIYNVMSKPIPRASEVNPAIPPALDAIIDRALQRDRAERFQTAKEMRDALEAFVTSAGGVTHEELGTLTKTLFAETRQKVQAQVKSQLATLSLGRISESGRHSVAIAEPQTDTQIRNLTQGLANLDEGIVENVSSASLYRVVTGANVSAPRSVVASAAWIAIALLGLGGGAVFLRSQSRAPAPPPPATAEAAPPPATTPAPPTVTTAVEPPPPPPPTMTTTATQPSHPPVAPPTPRAPVYTPPRAAAAPSPAPAPAPTVTEAPKPSATPAAPTTRPQEAPTSTGRSFRRDL